MARTSVETIVFGAISVISLPGAVILCWLGLRGEFLDAGYRENVLAGFAFLLFGSIPPALALASWICDKGQARRRGFEVPTRRGGEKAA